MTLQLSPASAGRERENLRTLIPPDPSRVFLERSRRFDTLAKGHSLAGWLSFLGRLTRAQHELLQGYPAIPLPDEAALSLAAEQRMPPLSSPPLPRGLSWQQPLDLFAQELAPHAPPPARDALRRLRHMGGAALEALADRILQMAPGNEDTDLLPFVAAVLQVHWTALAARLDRTMVASLDAPGVCPCCGFLPVAAVVRTDGPVAGLRYLHCALCNTEWHLVRVTCAACRNGDRISYRYIEGSDGTARAETCDDCRSYLKIFYREKSPQADPVADDLSSMALDLLVEEAGYNRIGPDLLLVPGAA
ncbi:MAG TPA: formate dehydrogenase accessory protein FdhE [Syntrophales bacterium]|nr:formate dehydrogenase accessory protein FdhE [Syntrophales bacterium]